MLENIKTFLRKHGVLSTQYHKIAKKQYYRFETYSTYRKDENELEYVLTNMRILIHELEKGFSLPIPKNGFGKEKTERLVHLIQLYEKNYKGSNDALLLYAKSILRFYVEKKDMYQLDVNHIPEELFQDSNLSDDVGFKNITYNEMKQCLNAEFGVFAQSRHSMRVFLNKTVKIDDIKSAVKLAQSAPSACNRQAVKIYHISGSDVCNQVLDIQGGYKGASTVNDILVVTADLTSYTGLMEVNTGYVDGGIFAMNLMYALHYYNIGSCPLLWNDDFDKGERIRKIFNIPISDMIVLLVPIGYYDETNIKYAVSKRKALEEVFISL